MSTDLVTVKVVTIESHTSRPIMSGEDDKKGHSVQMLQPHL